ncbi:carbohydrate porin [Klebsiella quasipneumoniae]|uniref:carbohydrate porin n=1 Tax=Klebsiella quasipneumoniae TaxID=1463165 RepID=UPI003DA1C0B2
MNDKTPATTGYQTQIGAVYKGLFDSRPQDYIGLGFSKMHANDRVAERAHCSTNSKERWIITLRPGHRFAAQSARRNCTTASR